jgi:hypothetical protein
LAIDDRHPEFTAQLGEWEQMRDTYLGERAVKRKRLDYLPPSEAQIQDGMTTPSSPGWKDYEAYLTRAFYHDVVRDAVKAMIGIMHMKPAIITLPPRLAPMMDKATIQGEGMQMLIRRINEAQLVYGRCGLLVDAPTGVDPADALPYISFYDPQRIINWDSGRRDEGRNQLELVVLDESGFQREGFTWVAERKHRILTRGSPESLESGWTRPQLTDPYMVCVKVNDMSMPIPDDFITPSIAGRNLTDIPFVFIGANDLVPEPDEPPLLGLSNLALAIYRGEADYRSTLFYQGQQTLVIIGGNVSDVDENEQLRIGNKGVIDLRIGGDAKYIGVSAAGLGEMRQAITNDDTKAAQFGVQFMDVGSARGASGEALRIRVAARTTTIQQIAVAAGAGLESALKLAAQWVGEDPDEVSVVPQTDFADANVAGASLLAFMQAKQLGLPLSLKSLHRMMQLNDMTDMDFEEENDQIEEESESLVGMMVHGANIGDTDESFLDTEGSTGVDPIVPGAETVAPAQPAPGEPPTGTIPAAPTGAPVPVTPHRRHNPTPLKRKVGAKGASAKK